MGGNGPLTLDLPHAPAGRAEIAALASRAFARGADRRDRKGEASFASVEGVFERKRQLGLNVLALRGAPARENILRVEAALCSLAEQRFEEIAESFEGLGVPSPKA